MNYETCACIILIMEWNEYDNGTIILPVDGKQSYVMWMNMLFCSIFVVGCWCWYLLFDESLELE